MASSLTYRIDADNSGFTSSLEQAAASVRNLKQGIQALEQERAALESATGRTAEQETRLSQVMAEIDDNTRKLAAEQEYLRKQAMEAVKDYQKAEKSYSAAMQEAINSNDALKQSLADMKANGGSIDIMNIDPQILAQVGISVEDLQSKFDAAREKIALTGLSFDELFNKATKSGKQGLGAFANEGQTLTQRLNEVNNSLTVTSSDLGDTGSATETLRSRMRQLKEEMAALALAGKENTAEYVNMKNELAKLTDTMGDINQQAKVLSNDNAGIAGIRGGLTAISGAAQMATASIALFGGENDRLQKSMVYLSSALSAVSGLYTVMNELNKDSAFVQGIVNKAKEWWIAITQKALATQEAENAAIEENIVATTEDAAATTAEAAANNANAIANQKDAAAEAKDTAAKITNATATNAATAANWTFVGAIKAVGLAIKSLLASIPIIGWLLAAIGTLTYAVYEWVDSMKDADESAKKIKETLVDVNAQFVTGERKLNAYMHQIKTFRGNIHEEKRILSELRSEYKGLITETDNLASAERKLMEHGKAYLAYLKLKAQQTALSTLYQQAYGDILKAQIAEDKDAEAEARKLFNAVEKRQGRLNQLIEAWYKKFGEFFDFSSSTKGDKDAEKAAEKEKKRIEDIQKKAKEYATEIKKARDAWQDLSASGSVDKADEEFKKWAHAEEGLQNYLNSLSDADRKKAEAEIDTLGIDYKEIYNQYKSEVIDKIKKLNPEFDAKIAFDNYSLERLESILNELNGTETFTINETIDANKLRQEKDKLVDDIIAKHPEIPISVFYDYSNFSHRFTKEKLEEILKYKNKFEEFKVYVGIEVLNDEILKELNVLIGSDAKITVDVNGDTADLETLLFQEDYAIKYLLSGELDPNDDPYALTIGLENLLERVAKKMAEVGDDDSLFQMWSNIFDMIMDADIALTKVKNDIGDIGSQGWLDWKRNQLEAKLKLTVDPEEYANLKQELEDVDDLEINVLMNLDPGKAFEKQMDKVKDKMDAISDIGGIASSFKSVAESFDKLGEEGTDFCDVLDAIIDAFDTIIDSVDKIGSALEILGGFFKKNAEIESDSLQQQNQELDENSMKTAENTGQKAANAMVSGAKSGAEAGPFAALPMIAAIIAAVMAAIGMASSFAKFASGGIVGNQFSGYGSDSIPALLGNREMVLNASQQANLWKKLNSRSDDFTGGGNVTFTIRGRDLEGVLRNYESKSNKAR